jgi:signal transduction histidine kinase
VDSDGAPAGRGPSATNAERVRRPRERRRPDYRHWGEQPSWPGDWRRDRGRVNRRGLFLPILVGLIQLTGTLVPHARSSTAAVPDLAYVLLLIGPAALIWRRTQPVPVYAVTLATTAIYLAVDVPRGPFFLATVIALFTAARRAPNWLIWLLSTIAYVAYVAVSRLLTSVAGVPTVRPSFGGYVVVAVVSFVLVAFAEGARIRSEAFREMARARQEAARAQEEQERRQASDERLRIARELHDVLGHHLSLINVRAGVALHLLESRPEQVRDALDAIKLASAEALREVRGVLATLTPTGDSDSAAPRAPMPGLADLDRLVDEARAAGLPVTVDREPTSRPVPPEVDRAAYRIVQEALTNVRRHAGSAATATVSVHFGPMSLTIRVDDDGANDTTTPDGTGNGIPGMRERAAAFGGSLSAGPRPGGGFTVEVTLPVGPDPATARSTVEGVG